MASIADIIMQSNPTPMRPLQAYMHGQQIGRQNRLSDLQARSVQAEMDQAEQANQRRQRLSALAPQLSDPATRDKAIAQISAEDIEIGQKYQELFAKQDEAAFKKSGRDMEEAAATISGVLSAPPEQRPFIYAKLYSEGRIPNNLSPNYDEATVNKLAMMTDVGKRVYEQQYKERQFQQQNQQMMETGRHNRVMENKPTASTNINFGGLTPAVDKETGELTFIQASNRGGAPQAVTGYAPPPKEPSARDIEKQDKVARIDDAISVIDAAIASTNENTVGARGALNSLVEAGSAQLGKPVGTQSGDRANLEAIIQSTSWRDLVGSGQLSKSDYSMLNRVTGGGLFTHAAQSKNDLIRLKQLLAQSKGGPRSDTPNISTPKTESEFNALPSGAVYIDPDDGKPYRRP